MKASMGPVIYNPKYLVILNNSSNDFKIQVHMYKSCIGAQQEIIERNSQSAVMVIACKNKRIILQSYTSQSFDSLINFFT